MFKIATSVFFACALASISVTALSQEVTPVAAAAPVIAEQAPGVSQQTAEVVPATQASAAAPIASAANSFGKFLGGLVKGTLDTGKSFVAGVRDGATTSPSDKATTASAVPVVDANATTGNPPAAVAASPTLKGLFDSVASKFARPATKPVETTSLAQSE